MNTGFLTLLDWVVARVLMAFTSGFAMKSSSSIETGSIFHRFLTHHPSSYRLLRLSHNTFF